MPRAEEPRRNLEPTLHIVEIPNPFDGLTDEAKKEAIATLAKESEVSLRESLSRITEKLLPAINPLHVLAHFAFYDNLLIPARNRVDRPKDSEYIPLDQGHIELLQALILRLPDENLGGPLDAGYSQILEELQNEAKKVLQSWSLSRLDTVGLHENTELIEFFRGRTAIVRNWGDTRQVLDWLEALFSNEDKKLEAKCGVSFTCLVRFVRWLLDLLEERFEARRQRIRPVLMAESKSEMISKYLDLDGHDNVEEGFARMMNLDADEDYLRHIIFTHYDCDLWSVFAFEMDELSKDFSETEKSGLRVVLNQWSLGPGALKEKNIEHLFMDNPVWGAPLIRITRDCYFWPLVHVFQSFGLEMLTGLLSGPERKSFESNTRPQFAEDRVGSLFVEAFPGAEIFRNTQYTIDGAQYENDCCVILDAYCFCVEVKSGRLKSSAKRGSSLSLGEGLDDLIGEGATQATRFIRALNNSIPMSDTEGRLRAIDTGGVRHYIPMVVTFEHFGEVAANKNTLVNAGYLREDITETLCMCLPDLERVFQVLPSVSQRLHYLVRRASIEQNFKFRGDELDLLVFYLKTGFAIGEAEFSQEKPLMFSGLSTELDGYLMDITGTEPRPSRFLAQRWKAILDRLEERRFPNWTEAAYILLGVDQEGMEGLEKNLLEVCESIKKGRHKKGDNDFIVCGTGPEKRRQAFGFTVGSRQTQEERHSHVQSALAMVEKNLGQIDTLIFAIDVSLPDAPYHGMYFVEEGKWESGKEDELTLDFPNEEEPGDTSVTG